MVVAVAAAIVVVFFVPLPHASLFHSLVTPASTTTKPPPKLPVVDVSATPTGWVPVAYGDAQISVPPGFPVAYPGQTSFCKGASASGPGGLLVDIPPGETVHCVVERHPTMVYWASVPLPSSVAFEHIQKKSILLNGVRVHRIPTAVTYFGYYAPSLGVQVIAQGPLAKRILGTLTRSPRTVALAPGSAPSVPSSWQSVTFAGLSFSAPAGWRTYRTSMWLGLGGFCTAQGVALTGDVVSLTTDTRPGLSGCAPIRLPPVRRPGNAVQVDSGLSPLTVGGTFSEHCLALHGLTACPATSPAYSILVLKVTVPGRSKPVYVSIGLAGNGMVARTILLLAAGGIYNPDHQPPREPLLAPTTTRRSRPGSGPNLSSTATWSAQSRSSG